LKVRLVHAARCTLAGAAVTDVDAYSPAATCRAEASWTAAAGAWVAARAWGAVEIARTVPVAKTVIRALRRFGMVLLFWPRR